MKQPETNHSEERVNQTHNNQQKTNHSVRHKTKQTVQTETRQPTDGVDSPEDETKRTWK